MSLSADLMFSERVTEIKTISGSTSCIYCIPSSVGIEVEILYTLNPLFKRSDSIILQAKPCSSPSGVHIIALYLEDDFQDIVLAVIRPFINLIRLFAVLVLACSVATSS